jgi:hypothetical protein
MGDANMTTRNRETSAEWAATIVEPITAEKALERLKYAYDYSTDAINAVMSVFHGTVPPSRDMMPDLYDAREKVETAISSIGSLAERVPQSHVGANYVDLGRKLGARLIDESNAAMDRSKKGESPGEVVQEVAQVAERAVGAAAKGLIRIGGMMLTPMEALLGAVLIDEVFNGGKIRRGILGGKRLKS